MTKILIIILSLTSTVSYAKKSHIEQNLNKTFSFAKSPEHVAFFLAISSAKKESIRTIYNDLKNVKYKPSQLNIKNNKIYINKKYSGIKVTTKNPFFVIHKGNYWRYNYKKSLTSNYFSLKSLLSKTSSASHSPYFSATAFAQNKTEEKLPDPDSKLNDILGFSAFIVGTVYAAIANDRKKKPDGTKSFNINDAGKDFGKVADFFKIFAKKIPADEYHDKERIRLLGILEHRILTCTAQEFIFKTRKGKFVFVDKSATMKDARQINQQINRNKKLRETMTTAQFEAHIIAEQKASMDAYNVYEYDENKKKVPSNSELNNYFKRVALECFENRDFGEFDGFSKDYNDALNTFFEATSKKANQQPSTTPGTSKGAS